VKKVQSFSRELREEEEEVVGSEREPPGAWRWILDLGKA